jgi:protein-disulfide isomerase
MKAAPPTHLRLLLVPLAAFLCLGRSVSHREPQASSAPATDAFKAWLAKQRRQPMPLPEARARVVVVQFNDYQCRRCRAVQDAYAPVLARFRAAHPRAVQVVLKDFPLAAECNAAVAESLHPAACEAAVAMRLARDSGHEDELAAWLFAHQASLTTDSVRAAARAITARDHGRSDYDAALSGVKQDVALGQELGVRGTPTFFINGVRVGAVPPPLFEVALEQALAQTATGAD